MLKTLIAVAVAGAFALPMAAQSSPVSDNIQIAQAGGAGGAGGAAGGAAGTGGAAAGTGGAAAGTGGAAAGGGAATGAAGGAGGGPGAPGTGAGAASGAAGGDSNAGAPGGNAAMGFSDRRFNDWDKNHDGYISRDEANDVSELNTRFSEMDKNNDGKISRDEARAHGSAAGGGTSSGVPVQQGGTKGEKGKQ